MIILGIETSCDETAVSIIQAENSASVPKVLSNVVSSQIKLHSRWGGVVPNLAAREHLKNILPVLEKSLQEANLKPCDIDLIAVTGGPGLIPALLIGVDTAKTLSYIWKKPLIGIHHIEGHIYANFISEKISESSNFPLLCLVVSGGHTQLILMKNHLHYSIIGQTLDDAAGEAFDKVARILKLGYPGGPAIAACAAKSNINNYALRRNINTLKINGVEQPINLPRPMINKDNFDFSFSGLKTAVLYLVKKIPPSRLSNLIKSQIAGEFQQATIDVLVSKTIKAARKYNPKTIMIAGGVSANQELRKQLGEAIKKNLPDTKYQIPDIGYSIDNAAMIAVAGFFRWQKMTSTQKKSAFDSWKKLQADANLKL